MTGPIQGSRVERNNMSQNKKIRATTILAVRKDGRCVMAGDGQVTLGETIMKHKAKKVRYMYDDSVIVGFAGAAADAFNLFDKLEGKLDKIIITIVFRSTCSDSREQLPRLFKILNELNYDVNSITLIGVDREKQGLSSETEGLSIELVPTIIIYIDGSEIGRIVETPAESLEKDLLKILL